MTATIMGPAKSPAAHPEDFEMECGKKGSEISSMWLNHKQPYTTSSPYYTSLNN